ncbi:MAG: CHRD domain-containing protein [Thermoanaerobaculia bacterium]|jgi:hypothetical protein|nr:CHRD domain-containing protein [Thermoanaerobaculia bacterium]MBP9824411.1 CHRD domain-containing protein [Thermoanaerobaculia bacterium]
MRELRYLVFAPLLAVAALVLAGGLAAGPAAAQAIFDGALDGASANPPTASTATGATELTIDEDQLVVDFSFSGLTGNSTAAHIHCCATPPSNVGVAVNYLTFPLGVTSGAYANTFDLGSTATYFAAFVTANGGTAASAKAALLAGFAAGRAYTCVHTTNFGGGEIRSHFGFASFLDGFESGDADDWSDSVP